MVIDDWELVLHHTYTGTPGVIFDHSPKRKCPGFADNLDAGCFAEDGAEAGSGSVAIRPNGLIRVPADPDVWARETPIKFEITCVVDDDRGGVLFGGNVLELEVVNGELACRFLSYGFIAEWSTASTSLTVPRGRWTTLGCTYDGLTDVQLSVDGQSAIWRQKLAPVAPQSTDVIIGAPLPGGTPTGTAYERPAFAGRIDDVKVWRLQDNRASTNFGSRPVDAATADCWLTWGDRLREALRGDPDCAAELKVLVEAAVRSVQQEGLLHSDEVRDRWRVNSYDYLKFWTQGDLYGASGTIDDLLYLLRKVGLDPTQNTEVQALLASPCFMNLRDIVGPPDCDRDFIDIFRNPGKSDEASR